MAQPKGRPTDTKRTLRREKEKELSTLRDPSRFELVDQAIANKEEEIVIIFYDHTIKAISSPHNSEQLFQKILAPISKPRQLPSSSFTSVPT